MPYTYDYPRPALTVDCVVFGLDEEDFKVVLIQRDLEPFAGKWALPGGFVHVDESLEDAARAGTARGGRPVEGLPGAALHLRRRGPRPPRADRHRGLLRPGQHPRPPRAGRHRRPQRRLVPRDRHAARWPSTTRRSCDAAWSGSRARSATSRSASSCCRTKFTLSQLQHLYETILERPLDKRNFRRKVLCDGLAGGDRRDRAGRGPPGRPALPLQQDEVPAAGQARVPLFEL